jgi:hypothetical protein
VDGGDKAHVAGFAFPRAVPASAACRF